jgi:Fe2+ transport system protein FeoA
MLSLAQLRPGQRGRIINVDGADSLVQRLVEMGLLDGEEIEVIAVAPLGDPVEVRLHDFRLSLRRNDAAHIWLSPLP